jgi:hypothetical protein
LLYPIKTANKNGVSSVFDHIRKKYVKLTPEEMVRQIVIKTLVENYAYPKECIAVEKRIKVNQRFLRFDVLVYHNAKPWLLVECKSQDIELTTDTFLQSLAYHSAMPVSYIILSNGNEMLCMDIAAKQWLTQVPKYPGIL